MFIPAVTLSGPYWCPWIGPSPLGLYLRPMVGVKPLSHHPRLGRFGSLDGSACCYCFLLLLLPPSLPLLPTSLYPWHHDYHLFLHLLLFARWVMVHTIEEGTLGQDGLWFHRWVQNPLEHEGQWKHSASPRDTVGTSWATMRHWGCCRGLLSLLTQPGLTQPELGSLLHANRTLQKSQL